ncbi:MAG: DUF2203 family protein [Acidimicrobiia bacterium]|nr:DUF2203 family protein [Acidimicrobiia bacterium]
MNRLFSLSEANSLIPQLKVLLAKVQAAKRRMMEMKPHLEKAVQAHVYDWGSRFGCEYVGILDAFQLAVHDIEELGVVIKDLDLGLCDFPHQRDGRVVYLCWKQDEKEVAWWHDLDSGFAGRQPV